MKNPGAIIEESIRHEKLKDFFSSQQKVETLLDLGCGTRPYHHLYKAYAAKTIGAELPGTPFPSKDIDIYCPATDIPLANESVDTVLCTEVMHDIAEPSLMLKEVNRILKKNGTLILTTPFVVPVVDGRFDHYRYTEQGLRYLLDKEQFTYVSITPVSDVFGAAITLYVKPWLRFWNKLAKLLRMRFIYSPVNPVFFITVTLPQLMYLMFAKIPLLKTFFNKFSYGAIGYITIAKKQNT